MDKYPDLDSAHPKTFLKYSIYVAMVSVHIPCILMVVEPKTGHTVNVWLKPWCKRLIICMTKNKVTRQARNNSG